MSNRKENYTTIMIKKSLRDRLVTLAANNHRSIPMQLEHWCEQGERQERTSDVLEAQASDCSQQNQA